MILIFVVFFLQLDYVVYRRVLRYYSGEEDGLRMLQFMTLIRVFVFGLSLLSLLICVSDFCIFFKDMRKALSRDVEKKSIIPLKRLNTPDELEYD